MTGIFILAFAFKGVYIITMLPVVFGDPCDTAIPSGTRMHKSSEGIGASIQPSLRVKTMFCKTRTEKGPSSLLLGRAVGYGQAPVHFSYLISVESIVETAAAQPGNSDLWLSR